MQVGSFLGTCNVYRSLVMVFAKIASWVTDMTRNDSDFDCYNITEAQDQAFENLKRCIIALLILAIRQYGCSYMIDADASAYDLGCTLLQ